MQKDRNRETNNSNKIIKIILRKFYLVILVAAIFAGACFACFTYLVKPDVESTLVVYISDANSSTGDISAITGMYNTTTATSEKEVLPASTYETIVKSKSSLEPVIEYNSLATTYNDLCKMISVDAVGNDSVYRISVKCKDIELAKTVTTALSENISDTIYQVLPSKTVTVINTEVTENIYTYRTLATIVAGIIGSILISILIVSIKLADKTIRNEEDLLEVSKLPVLGIIPDLFDGGGKRREAKLDRNSYYIDRYSYNLDGIDKNQKKHNDRNDRNVIGENLGYDATEAYKHLRTNIEFALSKPRNDGCKVIGITSSVRGEGKSVVACNLAYSMVENNKKVLLIDADLRSPSLNDKLRVHNKAGLIDCLEGTINPVDAIYNYDDNNPNLQLILGDTSAKKPSELLSSSNTRKLIDGLRDGYDFIIIDLPSVNIVADALTISEVIDSYVIVVRSDYSIKDELKDCIKSIAYFDTSILGFVLTDVNDGRIYYNPKPGRRNPNTTSKRSSLFYTSESPKKTQGSIVIEKEYSEAYKKADEILKKFENKDEDEYIGPIDEAIEKDNNNIEDIITDVFDDKKDEND